MQTRFLVSLFATAALTSFAGCSSDDTTTTGPDSTITVDNQSVTAIDEIKIGPPGKSDFGSDLLAGVPLDPQQSITVSVFCDSYDVQFTTEDNVTCVATDINVCGSDATWTITEDDINGCANNFTSVSPRSLTLTTSKTK